MATVALCRFSNPETLKHLQVETAKEPAYLVFVALRFCPF